MKLKVLFVSESPFVGTGYGVYTDNVLKRLADTGKYDLALHAIYGPINDIRARRLPYIYYGNQPLNPNDQEYKSYHNAQFGGWRFNHICCDFRAHCVQDLRDVWMSHFIGSSPLREYYKFLFMSTVDSYPQMLSWLPFYTNCDVMLNYSEFGTQTLIEQGGGKINTCGEAPASVDYNIFFPVRDKKSLKAKFGLNPDSHIIGTVNRNQVRKLYPDLFDAFKQLLDKYHQNGQNDLVNRTFLYCHTCYPDLGWNIPKLLLDYGITNKVYFTYQCERCKHIFPSLFQDIKTLCPKCKIYSASMPSTQNGISRENLAAIINTFDLGVQVAVCEGQGIFQNEVAACGIHFLSVDYSAMHDIVNNLKGSPIPVQRMFHDHTLEVQRALPDNAILCDMMHKYFNKPAAERTKLGYSCYLASRKKYDWDFTTKKWMEYLDKINPDEQEAKWKQPPKLHQPILNIPNIPKNSDFVKWCLINILGDPKQIESHLYMRILRDLNFGFTSDNYSDLLLEFNQKAVKNQFGREQVVKFLLYHAELKNKWEKIRCGIDPFPMNDTIKYAINKK